MKRYTSRATIKTGLARRNDTGIHPELAVIGPDGFLLFDDFFQQHDLSRSAHHLALGKPDLTVDAGLLEIQRGSGIQSREAQPPGDGVDGLCLDSRPGFTVNGSEFAARIEMTGGLARDPRVVLHSQPIRLVEFDAFPDDFARIADARGPQEVCGYARDGKQGAKPHATIIIARV